MAGDDFIDVCHVNKGVPNGFWVDHRHRPTSTPVQASRFVDPHAARAVELGLLYFGFAVVKGLLGGVVSTTRIPIATLVGAKENVALVIRVGLCHGLILGA
jgi:hypothetical protein